MRPRPGSGRPERGRPAGRSPGVVGSCRRLCAWQQRLNAPRSSMSARTSHLRRRPATCFSSAVGIVALCFTRPLAGVGQGKFGEVGYITRAADPGAREPPDPPSETRPPSRQATQARSARPVRQVASSVVELVAGQDDQHGVVDEVGDHRRGRSSPASAISERSDAEQRRWGGGARVAVIEAEKDRPVTMAAPAGREPCRAGRAGSGPRNSASSQTAGVSAMSRSVGGQPAVAVGRARSPAGAGRRAPWARGRSSSPAGPPQPGGQPDQRRRPARRRAAGAKRSTVARRLAGAARVKHREAPAAPPTRDRQSPSGPGCGACSGTNTKNSSTQATA